MPLPLHLRPFIRDFDVTCSCGATYTIGTDALRPVDTTHTHDTDTLEWTWIWGEFYPRDAEDDRREWERVMRGGRAIWATEWTVESPNYRKGN